MKKLETIVEKNDDGIWLRVVGKDYLANGYGDNTDEAIENLRAVIKDYLENEGATDRQWKNINPDTVEFDLKYDLEAFFTDYSFINITSIAKQAKISPSLLRQYASGVKHASDVQTRKLEDTIHEMGRKLQKIHIRVKSRSAASTS